MSEHSTTPCRMDFRSLSAAVLHGDRPVVWNHSGRPAVPFCLRTSTAGGYAGTPYLSPGWRMAPAIDRAEITGGQWDSLTIEFLSLPAREQERLMTYLATDHTLVHA